MMNLIKYKILFFLQNINLEIFLKIAYLKKMGCFLNLKKPKKLSEKIQWLKLYDNNREKEELTDKLKVKEYIKKTLPELKIAKVYQVAKSFKEIDINKLPNKFIIKTNNACKTNRIVYDKTKLTKEKLKEYSAFFTKALNYNYAYIGFGEKQYKNISKKIFVEEFIYKDDNIPFFEYEIWCFNGKVEFIIEIKKFKNIDKLVTTTCIYDKDWKKEDFYILIKDSIVNEKPKNLKKLIEYSEILSKNFSFVRVDLFEYEENIYFGEMTFTPYSGFVKFTPKKYDVYYGKKLKIDLESF